MIIFHRLVNKSFISHCAASKALRLFLLAMSVLMTPHYVLAAPLAILSDVDGLTHIVRAGHKSDGKNALPLKAGDVVKVQTGRATIFYASRAPQQLSAGKQARVGSAAPSQSAPVWRGLLANLSTGFSRRGQTRPLTVRGNPNAPQPLSPLGLVDSTQPLFSWLAPKDAAEAPVVDYEIALFDEMKRELWRTTATGALSYPADAPRLEAGQIYSWRITPRRVVLAAPTGTTDTPNSPVPPRYDEINRSQTVAFRIADARQIQMAQTAKERVVRDLKGQPEPIIRLALSQTWGQHGFYLNALQTLVPAIYKSAGASALTPATNAGDWLRAADRLDASSRLLFDNFQEQLGESSSPAKLRSRLSK